MAEKGAPGLSLREVAREMGVVSSALYRYFPTRDDLLTALIVDAYNDLGAFAERAVSRVPRDEPRRRLHAAAAAIRKWAKANPNEYALLYGSPVPGYEAPPFTVEPAARVALVLGTIVVEAWHDAGTGERHGRVGDAGPARNAHLDDVMPGVPEIGARSLADGVVAVLRLHQLRALRSLQGNGAQRQPVLRVRRRRGRRPRPAGRATMTKGR